MPMFLHMHDGEPVYYTDVCEICAQDAAQPAEDIPVHMLDIGETAAEVHERLCGCGHAVPEYDRITYADEPKQAVKRRLPDAYDIRNFLRTLVILFTWIGIVLLDFMVFTLLAHGTVKW